MLGDKPYLQMIHDRFDVHRQHPEVSVEEYVVQQEATILCQMHKKCIVYLDQNYWCYCRDAAQGRPQREGHAQLYSLLVQGVERGTLICPANYAVIHETCKQGDRALQLATARVIDHLSGRVAIKSLYDLTICELLDYWDSQRGGERELRRSRFCWTKIGCCLGTPVVPRHPLLSDSDNIAIQKAFVDYMLDVPLVRVLERCAFPSARRQVDEINRGCAEEPHRTFDQLFQAEVFGVAFSVAEMVLESTGTNLLELEFLKKLTQTVTPTYVGPYLRCVRIEAALKAEVRYQKQRDEHHQAHMFSPNDFDDHNHAAVALPHCHFFLTERVLTHLIRSRRLGYDEMFGCQVMYRPSDAIDALAALLSDG